MTQRYLCEHCAAALTPIDSPTVCRDCRERIERTRQAERFTPKEAVMDRNVDRDLQRQLDELQAGFDAMRAAHQAQIVALTEQRLQRLCEWSHVEPQDSFRRGLVSVVGRGLVGAARRLPWPRPQPTATNDSDPQVVEVAGRLINHPPHDSAGAKDGR